MKCKIAMLSMCLAASCALGQTPPDQTAATTQPSSAPAPKATASVLAAESLRQSALSLIHSPSAPARAGRLVLLSQLAVRLEPNDSDYLALLTDIYEVLGKYPQAVKLARQRLVKTPDDFMLGIAYLRLGQAAQSTARGRLDFLDKVAADKSFNTYLRAQAHTQAAEILLGEGRKADAQKRFEAALRFDPYMPDAILGLQSFRSKTDEVDRLKFLLALVRASSNNPTYLWEAGLLLDSHGVYTPAVVFFDNAWNLQKELNPDSISEQMAQQYINALLDAGQYRKAIEVFVPLLARYPASVELKSLLAEAFRGIGDEARAKALDELIKAQLREMEILPDETVAKCQEVAWLYLFSDIRPFTALAYARKAAEAAAKESGRSPDESLELVLGAAQLRGTNPDEGVKRLKKLLGKDVYAAMFLAEYYYKNEMSDAGKETLLQGCKLTRRGRAFRRLAALATRQNVSLPADPLAQKLEKELATLDPALMAIGANPGIALSAGVFLQEPKLYVGQPVYAVAVLQNASLYPLSTGPSGLFNATMSVRVVATGAGDRREFADLPLIVTPAPRYIEPKQAAYALVRLDVGELDEFLMRHPLDPITLYVTGTLDPITKGNEIISSVPSVDVQTLRIYRLDMLGSFDRMKGDWTARYQEVLAALVKTMRSPETQTRMFTARSVASMLTLISDVQLGRTTMPRQLGTAVKQPYMLSMMRELLKDKSPVVRAEMVSSLIHCKLDKNILQQLNAVLDDPNALVRFRVAELIGVKQPDGWQKLLERYRKDSDPMVREMAALFR